MRVTNRSFRFFLCSFLIITLDASVASGAEPNIDACAARKNLLEQISCYAAKAKAADDPAPCDQAALEGVRYQCYAIFAEYAASPDVCRRIPATTDEHRALIDVCLSDVALRLHDPDLCEQIVTSGLRDSCYLKLARELSERDFCVKIKDDGLRSSCTGAPVFIK
jgi:hypothetical protein